MLPTANNSLTDAMNNAATPARSVVEEIIDELNSSFGDRVSSIRAYKKVESATLINTTFDPAALDVFGNIEIFSLQQKPDGDNFNTHRPFLISRIEARHIAQAGPRQFHAQFQEIADVLEKEYTAYAFDTEARHERQRIQGITDTVNQMSRLDRHIPAPKIARFAKRK